MCMHTCLWEPEAEAMNDLSYLFTLFNEAESLYNTQSSLIWAVSPPSLVYLMTDADSLNHTQSSLIWVVPLAHLLWGTYGYFFPVLVL